MVELDVSNCSGDVCTIHKGVKTSLDVKLTANQDTSKVQLKLVASLNGLEIEVPNYDKDACKHLSCPVKKGQTVDFKYDIVVPTLVPNVHAILGAQLIGEQGLLACIKVKGVVAN